MIFPFGQGSGSNNATFPSPILSMSADRKYRENAKYAPIMTSQKKMRIPRKVSTSDLHYFIEQIGAKPYTCREQFFVELRPDTGRGEASKNFALGRQTALFKH